MRYFFASLLASTCLAAVPSHIGHLPIYFKPAAGHLAGSFQGQGLRYAVTLQPRKASIQLGHGSRHVQLGIDYLNSSPAVTLQPAGKFPTLASEFFGKDPSRWRTNIPTYARIAAKGIYPGIDLVYYGSDSGLEYDFVLAPSARPDQIRMHVSGAEQLSLNSAGDLILHTAAGNLIQHRPHVYQQTAAGRREVAAGFVIRKGREVSFDVGPYDHARPLTIDPQISFSSFLGDVGEEQGLAVAVDNSGNSYVAGYTTSNGYGDADLLILSIDPTGANARYIVQAGGSFGFGGSGDDVVNGIAVDGYGSLVAVGSTSSSDFPTTTGSFQPGGAGGQYDGFILRVDPAGQNLLFSTYFGGSGDDEIWAVGLDSLGNAYVAGDTTSTDLPTTPGVYQTANAGATDGFAAKFDASGNRIWCTYFGGASDENAYSLAIDAAGNSYITGFTDSSNFPTVNPYQGAYRGGDDVFVLKMNPTGTKVLYSTFLGGSGDEQGYAIALDAASNIYVGGSTSSSNFPIKVGAYTATFQGGSSDIFVTKLTPDGSALVYSTYIGSHGTDELWGLTLDAAGNVYLVGDTDSDQYPVAGGPQQPTRKGNLDAVITQLNASGSGLIYSSFLGGSGDDSAQSIARDAGGNLYITGYTSSPNFPVTSGSVEPTPGGGTSDAFLVKYSFPATPPVVNGVVNAASFTTGGPVAPGSIISIFGVNFTNAGVNAQSIPLSTTLGSVSATINGVPAPLFFASAGQLNAQVPFEVQPGPATLVVTGLAGDSAAAQFTVAATAPGIFTNGAQAVVQNPDGSINTSANPAHAGGTVTAYLTGIGPVDNPIATGAAASSSPVSSATLPVSVTINGTPATPQFLGYTPGSVGLAQANILIPAGISGDLPLVISIGGVPSNTATISIAQ